MRTATLSRRALVEQCQRLLDAHGDTVALDVRANALGLGVAEVSSLARDAGVRFALHSPGEQRLSALAESPGGHPVATGWWGSDHNPVVTFVASVVSVKRVPAGSHVSYGYRYTTAHETTLALVSAGFADGVPRSASGRAHISVGGHNALIAGRIAMDQCVLDCGDEPVSVGQDAVIWGHSPSLRQWSEWAGRSEGLLLSHIGDRVVKTWQ